MEPWLVVSIALGVVAVGVSAWLIVLHRGADRSADDGDLSRRGRTRDADGRVVKMIDPFPLYTLGRHDVIDETALAEIIETLEPGATRRRTMFILSATAVVMVVGGIGAMIAIEGRPAVDDLVSVVTNPAILAAIAGGVIVPIVAARQERMKKVRRVMLHHRRCPHCGYGLTGVPPRGGGGPTVCPECGRAWNLAEGDDGPEDAAAATAAPTWMLVVFGGLGVAALAGLALYFAMR